jgi:hypothetical protein
MKEHLGWLSESANEFNRQLDGLVSSQVTSRKQRLLADMGMTQVLGLPLKKRHGVPATYAVPVRRKAPAIERVLAEKGQFKPEPILGSTDYEEILRIIRNMVRVMELSPHAFQQMKEEDLRTHFLVQLNGQYEGQATAETFNFQGKTDILIREDGKNVFVAECKFWKGEKVLLETLDQILSYLAWRDTKAAVLLFNRGKNFSSVLEKITATVSKHPSFKRELGKSDESTFRYVFGQPNDPSRDVYLAVLAFDVPASAS